jgi:hypothetical protein
MRDRLARMDEEFLEWLEQIKRERYIKGLDREPVGYGRITKAMLRCPSIKKIEEEIFKIPGRKNA